VSDELSTTFELPTGSHAVVKAISKWEKFKYELHHPENHKQLVKFLCVGGGSYVLNLVLFTIAIAIGMSDAAAFITAWLLSCINNFWWSRHWTFDAREDHPAGQAVRFFAVSVVVALVAAGLYALIQSVQPMDKTLADGIAWAFAMPLSFLAQKFWSFKA
jgi:putative flippase GtrA